MRIIARCAAVAVVALISAPAIARRQNADLPIEPPRETAVTTSLADAASRNDFTAFDALYQAQPDAQFAELHRFWSWSMTDRLGAFYGAETHDALARLYPSYADFIEPYRMVDAHGNVLYPSLETRKFLLDQAIRGTPRAPPPVKKAPQRGAPLSSPPPRVVISPPPIPAPVRTPALDHQASVLAPVKAEVPPPPSGLARVIFLIIGAILAVGTVTLMLQTPREGNHSSPPP